MMSDGIDITATLDNGPARMWNKTSLDSFVCTSKSSEVSGLAFIKSLLLDSTIIFSDRVVTGTLVTSALVKPSRT